MIVFFYNISTVYLLGSFVAVRHRFGFGLAWLLVSAICFLVVFFWFGLFVCFFLFAAWNRAPLAPPRRRWP